MNNLHHFFRGHQPPWVQYQALHLTPMPGHPLCSREHNLPKWLGQKPYSVLSTDKPLSPATSALFSMAQCPPPPDTQTPLSPSLPGSAGINTRYNIRRAAQARSRRPLMSVKQTSKKKTKNVSYTHRFSRTVWAVLALCQEHSSFHHQQFPSEIFLNEKLTTQFQGQCFIL